MARRFRNTLVDADARYEDYLEDPGRWVTKSSSRYREHFGDHDYDVFHDPDRPMRDQRLAAGTLRMGDTRDFPMPATRFRRIAGTRSKRRSAGIDQVLGTLVPTKDAATAGVATRSSTTSCRRITCSCSATTATTRTTRGSGAACRCRASRATSPASGTRKAPMACAGAGSAASSDRVLVAAPEVPRLARDDELKLRRIVDHRAHRLGVGAGQRAHEPAAEPHEHLVRARSTSNGSSASLPRRSTLRQLRPDAMSKRSEHHGGWHGPPPMMWRAQEVVGGRARAGGV